MSLILKTDTMNNLISLSILNSQIQMKNYLKKHPLIIVKSADGLGWISRCWWYHTISMCNRCDSLWPDVAQSPYPGLDPILLRHEENRAALPACSLSIHSGTGASLRSRTLHRLLLRAGSERPLADLISSLGISCWPKPFACFPSGFGSDWIPIYFWSWW